MKKINGVICFGDSILAGTGASEREFGCVKLIKSALTIPVSLRGRNWNTSQDALGRLEEDVLFQRNLSHVVILLGNNDCWLVGPNQPKVTLEQFRGNVLTITERIKSNGQFPLLSNLQPIDPQRFRRKFPELFEYQKNFALDPSDLQRRYSEEIQGLASELDTPCIDIRKELESCSEDVIAPDGLHPNDSGHRIIARAILNHLKKLDEALEISSACQKMLMRNL